ncbi:CHAT domain-containing protein [Agrilutibacter solisilvae]|uniref:CHAT domain-containing protein n=1 Tax=Agrilutibacter solisilvae TaxID=2763317 RepID=A0A974XW06_9GAMM|nr:CHAT domain-containing protein [Lysobacter solisilvae]QSX76934.1 CHAT domain-containing protein [Lysobacter solisilvae]
MSQRTIVAVETMDDMFIGKIVRAPFAVAEPGNKRLVLDADALPAPGEDEVVLKRGQKLRDALRSHTGICGVLDNLSQSNAHNPLFVQLGPTDAEGFNWEALCDTKDAFFALDTRWPIARIVADVNTPPRPPSEMGRWVRVLAVISALKIKDQHKEWERLRNAIVAANGDAPWIRLKVLAGHPDLYKAIDDEKADLKKDSDLDVELGTLEDSATFLTQEIRAWAPNILHFFCHGHADALGQSLELATARDHLLAEAGGVEAGSVNLGAASLATLASSLPNAWLLVLNCCSTGKPVPGMSSMASQAVAAGFPSAVAMFEPVEASDAYNFTRAFYPGAFEALRQVGKALGASTSTTLEWTPLMHDVRAAISDGKPTASSPEWSLPVLYVRGLEAQVFIAAQPAPAPVPAPPVPTPTPTPPSTPPAPIPVPAPAAAADESHMQGEQYRVQVEEMARWLATAGQQLEPDDRRRVMEYALKDVPRPLWPNVEGRFDGDDR